MPDYANDQEPDRAKFEGKKPEFLQAFPSSAKS